MVPYLLKRGSEVEAPRFDRVQEGFLSGVAMKGPILKDTLGKCSKPP